MKKDYFSPQFELVELKFPENILGSEPEEPIHENDSGKEIED